MKRWLKWVLPVVGVVVIGLFVGRAIVARKGDEAARTAQVAAAKASAGLELTAADVIVVRRIELPRTLEISGSLKAVNTAVVRAKVSAEVTTLTVREGDPVRAGQVLGQLDTTELDLRLRQTEQSASSSKSQLDIASRALVNNRALVAQGFISPTGLETSISNEAGAQATYAAAQAMVGLARKARADATLVAPITGLVAQRFVQPGERVSVDTRVLEIVDLSRIELEAALTPDDVAALAIGRPATLRVDGIDAPVAARVARINPSAQAGTRAVMTYLAVEPQPALRQGLFARGTIEIERRRVLALPLSAVRTDQAQPVVLQIVDGKAVRTPVGLGVRGTVDGEGWVEIVSGLPDGARVLALSAGLVRDGTPLHLAAEAAAPAASAPSATLSTSPR